MNQARKIGEKRKTGPVQQPREGAEAATTSATSQHPIHDRLGTCSNRDRFTVVNTKRGKKAKKTRKPTPQKEEEDVDRVLLKRELKSEAPGEWRRVTEVPYGNYSPYLFKTSLTDMQLETHLFQAREFLQEFTRRRVDGDMGKEALEWAGHLLSAAHCKGVITDDEKAAMPLEGAYAIINWLLKCTQQADDNIITPMWRSMKDALHCEEARKEAQAAMGGVDQEKSQKARDHSAPERAGHKRSPRGSPIGPGGGDIYTGCKKEEENLCSITRVLALFLWTSSQTRVKMQMYEEHLSGLDKFPTLQT